MRRPTRAPGSFSGPHAAWAREGQHSPLNPFACLQRSVDRLGRAIEAAEEEMDAALRRTTELHKSQLRQKEVELGEMQRLLQAKEKAIESLRDTLATTKRTYESRLSQAEGDASLRDAEVGGVRAAPTTVTLGRRVGGQGLHEGSPSYMTGAA
jgi:hypothetical protein